MRNLKTLLQILLEEVKKDYCTGLCASILKLEIYNKVSYREARALHSFLNQNKPSPILHSEHYTEVPIDYPYWWPMGDTQVRIEFLEYLISLQPKTIKELLVLLLDGLKANGETGICNEIGILFELGKITKEEYKILRDYILTNKPTPTLHSQHYSKNKDRYWWPVYHPLFKHFHKKPRIQFLNYLIQLQNERP